MQTKLLTKRVPFTFNRNGYYYFTRRVPSDLRPYYKYPRIVKGLHTRSSNKARSQALVAAAKLDAYWSHLRMTDADLIGSHLLIQPVTAPGATVSVMKKPIKSPLLSEALSMYVTQKGANKGKTYKGAAVRACRYLIKACGNKRLSDYSREDALTYRDSLVNMGLVGSSIGRVLSSIKSIVNFVISEQSLEINNPFIGMYYDKDAGVSKRSSISIENIRLIQGECKKIDDDMRWLIAFLTDTGMRLAEVTGLVKSDIKLNDEIPYVMVRPHPWRRLKNTNSERNIPLVGSSLWAAERILSVASDNKFAFPRYNTTEITNANSASATLNKWLKLYVEEGRTLHSLRHSMRDRLREVECPSEIIDQVGGWATGGVGAGYGEGYPIKIIHKWLRLTLMSDIRCLSRDDLTVVSG